MRRTLAFLLATAAAPALAEMPPGVSHFTLGNGLDTTALLPMAVQEGVAFVPGASFFAHDPDRTTMRLSYVTNPPEIIDEGVERLGRALRRWRG